MPLSVGLIGSTCWNESFGFPEGAHNRGHPSNPTIYTTSPSLVEDWPLVWLVLVHFACPMISSVPHYCTVYTFHCPSQFVFFNKFIYLWLCWVFIAERGLSLVVASGVFSLSWLLLLRSMGSRRAGFSSCGTWAQ